MQPIQPFLWFDTQAEDAVNFYVSIFKDSKIHGTHRHGEGGPHPAGTVMAVSFELNGLRFIALNGGPQFKFTEAVSFLIPAETQEEIDELWEKLCSGGGEPGQCGWLKDKYGLSWQVAPPILNAFLADPDPVKSGKVMKAMMAMNKIVISDLKAAYEGN
jgi:predicted 3-demethylubiquinone-9 3-methyltransferase (glyoxalase superfamily)